MQFADPPMRGFMFERMARALRPSGLVLVEGYTPKQLEFGTGGPRELDQLYRASPPQGEGTVLVNLHNQFVDDYQRTKTSSLP